MQSLKTRSEDESKVIKMSSLDYIPDPRGLGYVFFSHMLQYKDKYSQVDALTGRKDTYKTLLQRCIRTAIAMRSTGITSGDIVTLCTLNHVDSCVPFLSSLFLGAKVASLDPSLSLDDIVHLLKQVTPKIIFAGPESVELIENTLKRTSRNIQIVVFGETSRHTSFSEFLRPTTEEKHFQPYEAENQRETAIIFFSSGTSGLPKGICINHFHLLSQLVNTIGFGFCIDVTLTFTSLYWITAVLYMGTAILTGSTRLVVPKFDVNIMWNVIDRFRPTFMVSAPNQLLAMVNKGRPIGVDVSSLKHIGVGGAPLIRSHILSIRKAFPYTTVCNAYGQTEVAMLVTVFKPSKPKEYHLLINKPTSCGTGVPGLSYKVVDPETEEVLGPNEPGELRLKTEFLLNGYFNRDSSEIWDLDGWYKTGDLVYYDEDRCFYVVDRIKELLKFQNWHVPPAVLENVLATHPKVANSVVIGIPHGGDDYPMALVVLKESCRTASPEEIMEYVNRRVDDKKKLRGGLKIVDHIPIANTGKIKRREIRDMVLQGIL